MKATYQVSFISHISLYISTRTNNTMIIDFKVSYKDYSKNILDFYGVWNYECPACKAKRQWTRHASYSRYLILFGQDALIEESLTILRLSCKSCGHTQAVLPYECVPYQIYSIFAIVEIILYYYQTKAVKSTCECYQISWQSLYHFLQGITTYLAPLELLLRQMALWSVPQKPTPAHIMKFLQDRHELVFAFFRTNRCFLFIRRQRTTASFYYMGC